MHPAVNAPRAHGGFHGRNAGRYGCKQVTEETHETC
jgi:hypothetical protein